MFSSTSGVDFREASVSTQWSIARTPLSSQSFRGVEVAKSPERMMRDGDARGGANWRLRLVMWFVTPA